MTTQVNRSTPMQQLANSIHVVDKCIQTPIAVTVHAAREFGEFLLVGATALGSIYTASVAHDIMEKVAGIPAWNAEPASWASFAACAAGAAVPVCTWMHGRFGTSALRGLIEGMAVAAAPIAAYGIATASHLGAGGGATAAVLGTLFAGVAAIASAVDAHYRGKDDRETIPEHDTFIF